MSDNQEQGNKNKIIKIIIFALVIIALLVVVTIVSVKLYNNNFGKDKAGKETGAGEKKEGENKEEGKEKAKLTPDSSKSSGDSGQEEGERLVSTPSEKRSRREALKEAKKEVSSFNLAEPNAKAPGLSEFSFSGLAPAPTSNAVDKKSMKRSDLKESGDNKNDLLASMGNIQ